MMLSVQHVSKKFGGVTALQNCTLTVQQGTITALIGPNGSGKTTLFDVISGLVEENSGTITFQERNIQQSAHTVAQAGISRTFQDVRLFRHLTIREHLLLAMRSDDTKLLRSFWHGDDATEYAARIKEALQLVQLDKSPNTIVTDLSYGQRKLLDLAIAISKPHTLLLLDEPVAGVNPRIRQIIKQVLQKLRRNGETILLIEHDMNFTMALADYIYVLDAGSVIADGKPAAVRKNPAVLEAYLGK